MRPALALLSTTSVQNLVLGSSKNSQAQAPCLQTSFGPGLHGRWYRNPGLQDRPTTSAAPSCTLHHPTWPNLKRTRPTSCSSTLACISGDTQAPQRTRAPLLILEARTPKLLLFGDKEKVLRKWCQHRTVSAFFWVHKYLW